VGLYEALGLFHDYRVRYGAHLKAGDVPVSVELEK